MKREQLSGVTRSLMHRTATDLEIDVATGVLTALEALPLDDRLGFLFGLLVGGLIEQKMSRDQILLEFSKGLTVAFPDVAKANMPQ